MTDTWNPAQYDKFQREREQPFFDLLSLVRHEPDMRVVDLGCGTGMLTRDLHARLQARETLGIDRSAKMLEASADALPLGLRLEVGTIEDFVDRAGGDERGYDLVFSNAALHWIEHHETLVGRLTAAIAPAGQLAFQVPAEHDSVPHLLAEELTTVEPFRGAFGGWHRPQPVLAPEAYARLLYRYGFANPIVRLIVYPHVLAGPEEVVEWVKGTLLTEYARHLSSDLFGQFVNEYRTRLLSRLDASRPLFYPYKRILCWGQRSA